MAKNQIASALARAFQDDFIFRANNLVPDDWQRQILETNQNTLVNVTRQGGKSLAVFSKAAHVAGTRPNSLILVTAPSERQVRELLKGCADLIIGAGFEKELASRQVTQLTFTNGSRIIGVPGATSTASNVRGYSALTMLIADEAAFIPTEFFQAIAPMLAVSKGQMICLTTPAGRRGFFYTEWTNNPDAWLRIEVPATLIKRIPKEFLEQQRKTLGLTAYEAEYCCKFSSGDGSLISKEIILACVKDVPTLNQKGERTWKLSAGC